jgi:hypothetical protein
MVVIFAGVDSQGPPFGLHTPARRWDHERLLDIAESIVGTSGWLPMIVRLLRQEVDDGL